MIEYIYFTSYRYQISPPCVSGTGDMRIIATQPITRWTDIEAMKSAIRDLHPEYTDVVLMNYQLLGTDVCDTLNATEQIEQTIGEHHGNVRDALNATLAQLDAANALLAAEREKSTALVEVLETTRGLIWRNLIRREPRRSES